MESKSSKIEAELGPEAPKWGQDGARTAKKSKNNKDPTKNRGDSHRAAALSPKSAQHGPNLGLKAEPKTKKK